MGFPPSTAELPATLAEAVGSWIEVVTSAIGGMGEDVMKVAAQAAMNLQRRVVMTRDLEGMLASARLASDTLGISLNRDEGDPSMSRIDALSALDGLVVLLRHARPSGRAKGLGLGW